MNTRFTVITLLALAGNTFAGTLNTPNGAYTGNGRTQSANGIEVRLMPAEYITSATPAELTDVLATQTFTWSLAANLTSGFTLDTYQAYVNEQPAIANYGFASAAENYNNGGGADIALAYRRAGNDPARADARWLQIIRTNIPTQWGEDHGMGLNILGGRWYIDNGWPNRADPQRDPFYGANDNDDTTGYWANGQGFIDQPGRTLANGTYWEAWNFIAKWNNAGTDLVIYDGVHYGFEMHTTLPAPGPIVLCAMGSLVAWRRRRSS